ncbi:MAG: hypothetical protein EI684_09960 [Candidatus Viridilinea halotolerans]|uniref:Glycosyltransferase RgtA/B/C/D-like domain-containing protein n=1 Tax=Candidatus Viridilinea halotolerans TaxID=2491704 RepID=A0A426U0Q7_9CHLR|nr:MAG: hypothetical protein EI684_09960 [Candidatus Viridilinea halotolerans]
MPQRTLTLDHVWLFAGVAFIALRLLLTPIQPHDFWWHMATGRVIMTTGQIPTVDSFSFTQAGAAFYNQSWLAQVLMYQIFALGGAPLTILVQAIMLAAAYGLLLRLSIRRSGAVRLSVGVLLLGTLPASFDNWLVRPQSYAIPLFIIYLYILTAWRDPRGQRASGLWPPLLLLPIFGSLWVNLHGSFVLGGVLIALTFVGELLRRWFSPPENNPALPPLWHLIPVGILTGLSWLLNPTGFAVLAYVRNLLGSSQVTQLVTEWAPPTIRTANGAIFFIFVIVGMVILSYARKRPDPVEMLMAVALLWLALGAARNNLWFVAVATPLFTRQLVLWRSGERRVTPAFQGMPLLNGVLIGFIALFLLLALPWVKPALGLPPEVGSLIAVETPVAAVEFMQRDAERPQRLFHAMSMGSYLIWAAPEQPVWADPRIELYPFAQWREYQQLSAAQDVERLLATYAIDGLLLSNSEQTALVTWANERPNAWALRYADEFTSYFVRVGG